MRTLVARWRNLHSVQLRKLVLVRLTCCSQSQQELQELWAQPKGASYGSCWNHRKSRLPFQHAEPVRVGSNLARIVCSASLLASAVTSRIPNPTPIFLRKAERMRSAKRVVAPSRLRIKCVGGRCAVVIAAIFVFVSGSLLRIDRKRGYFEGVRTFRNTQSSSQAI